MKYLLYLLGLFFTFNLHLQAQIELGECDKLCSPKAEKFAQSALKAFKAKNVLEVKRYCEMALRDDPDCPHALYIYGEMNVRQGKVKQAEAAWVRLLSVCPDYKHDVYFFLGVVMVENDKLESGLEKLKKFLTLPDRDRAYDKEAKKIITEFELINQLKSNPIVFNPKPLLDICTSEDEYLPVISPDGSLCFFTRRKKEIDRKSGPSPVERMVEKFSMASIQANGRFEPGKALSAPFNQKYNEGGPTITANNKELYFTVCEQLPSGYKNCDVYYTFKDELGYWVDLRSVGDHINREDSWESQPSVTPNGDWLYFASNRTGGMGGIDIYRCARNLDGTWAAPENLGKTINTDKDEKAPYIHSDAQTLYFSSNGHPGLGGFDVHYAQWANGDWQSPVNVGYPINSQEDELGLIVSLDGKTAFFSSNKLQGKGGWDIFYFNMPDEIRPEKVALINGTLNTEDGSLEGVQLRIKNLDDNTIQQITVEKETGKYTAVVTLKPTQDLIITAEKEGAAFSSRYIDASEMLAELALAPEPEEGEAFPKPTPINTTDLEIKKIKLNEEYRLNDIFFATNSYDLTKRSQRILEEFTLFLQSNPRVKIEIQGHTDNVGNKSDNQMLSQNRARVVYEYLIEKGIKSSRMTHRGFGPDKPLASNDTEEGKSQNRRTVFVIKAM